MGGLKRSSPIDPNSWFVSLRTAVHLLKEGLIKDLPCGTGTCRQRQCCKALPLSGKRKLCFRFSALWQIRDGFVQRFLIAFLVCVCWMPVHAGPINQLYEFLQARTFKSAFTQQVYDRQKTLVDDSRGIVAIERPGRFRWEYFSPHPKILVSDGLNFIVHDPELKQIVVRPLAEALAYAPIMMLARDKPDLRDFELDNRGHDQGLDWLHLRPKVKDMEFVRIEVGLHGASVRIMKMLDHFDQWTIIRFDDPQSGLTLEPYLFRVQADEETDVIGEFTTLIRP